MSALNFDPHAHMDARIRYMQMRRRGFAYNDIRQEALEQQRRSLEDPLQRAAQLAQDVQRRLSDAQEEMRQAIQGEARIDPLRAVILQAENLSATVQEVGRSRRELLEANRKNRQDLADQHVLQVKLHQQLNTMEQQLCWAKERGDPNKEAMLRFGEAAIDHIAKH